MNVFGPGRARRDAPMPNTRAARCCLPFGAHSRSVRLLLSAALLLLGACDGGGAVFGPERPQRLPRLSGRHRLTDGQLILLKADDVTCCPLDSGWVQFVALLRARRLRAGFGIIGNSLERPDPGYITFLRNLVADQRFELWNHGYDHECRPQDDFWEFRNSGYDYQKTHLHLTQALVRDSLGITMTAFGAPCNGIDSVTDRVVDEDSAIIVWLYGHRSVRKTVVVRTADAEYPTHEPNADAFITRYDSTLRYVTLQLHPGGWRPIDFIEFERILDFLAERQVQFVTPSEIAQVIPPSRF